MDFFLRCDQLWTPSQNAIVDKKKQAWARDNRLVNRSNEFPDFLLFGLRRFGWWSVKKLNIGGIFIRKPARVVQGRPNGKINQNDQLFAVLTWSVQRVNNRTRSLDLLPKQEEPVACISEHEILKNMMIFSWMLLAFDKGLFFFWILVLF